MRQIPDQGALSRAFAPQDQHTPGIVIPAHRGNVIPVSQRPALSRTGECGKDSRSRGLRLQAPHQGEYDYDRSDGGYNSDHFLKSSQICTQDHGRLPTAEKGKVIEICLIPASPVCLYLILLYYSRRHIKNIALNTIIHIQCNIYLLFHLRL